MNRLKRIRKAVEEYEWEEWDLFAQWKEEDWRLQHDISVSYEEAEEELRMQKRRKVMNERPCIYVRTRTGADYEIKSHPDWTVERLKEAIKDKSDIPVFQQRLIYGGKQLSDDKTLKDLNITTYCIIDLILALKGD